MNLRKLFLAVLAFVACIATAQQMPPIPVDENVRIGKLDNGLTYYIRYNNWPENRANFYIAQKVGSIQEEETQRGLAHFLEHMCFNGTKHFPGNEVMRYCESIGVQFGRDLNAYTSIDETVYNISNVPTTRQSALDSCLLILSDWSGALLLEDKEIDEERGVIHEEWRMRSSASSRLLERNLPKLYPGSKYGLRYPIGTMEVIDNFKYNELRDYYAKWYHPLNQGVIIVGDVDVDYMEAKIKEYFGGFKAPENPAPIVAESVPDNAEPIIIVDKDKEQNSSDVEIFFKHETFPNEMKDNMGYLVYNYVRNAMANMLNNRLSESALDPACPYVNAYAYDGSYIFSKTVDAFAVNASPKDMSRTADALKAALIEVKRAAQYGFTATEFERFKSDYLSSLEKQYSNKDKRTNDALYAPLKENFLDNEPMPSLDWRYEVMKQLVPMIPVEAVNEFIGRIDLANDSNVVIINFNNEAEGNVYPTEAGLLAALNEARGTEVTAFVDNVKNEPLITKLPKKGKIKKETKDEVLGYTTLELSNGVKVILKKTDYKKDQVLMSGFGFGGQTLYGESDYVNLQVFDDVIGASGLGSFSSVELRKALAGKIANADLTIGQTETRLSGSSTPGDVETMLQMAWLYFTNINKDQSSFDNLMGQYQVQLKDRELNPDVVLSDSLTATLYGHNKRTEPLTVASLAKVSYDRILQIAKERTASAKGWTFYIVGNYDEETIRPLICQYLAALPAKGKEVKSKREINMAKGEVNNTFALKQETPKSNAYMMWHSTSMPMTLKNDICVDVAGQILSMIYLDKIREKESAAYSVGAYGSASIGADDYRMFNIFAYCPMKPEKREIAIAILNEEVKKLETECDAEKLAKCKEFMLKQIGDKVKTNGYWLGAISNYQRFGYDEYTDYVKTVEALTPADICNFMKEFNAAGNHISVVMMPGE